MKSSILKKLKKIMGGAMLSYSNQRASNCVINRDVEAVIFQTLPLPLPHLLLPLPPTKKEKTTVDNFF